LRIALIYPKIRGYDRESFGTDGYISNMSGYPPLSLAYAASIIRRAGHDALIIDANIMSLSGKEIVSRLKEFSPDLLGFTLTTPTFHGVRAWIRRIRVEVNVPVLAGGALLGLFPREVMGYQEFDYGIVGTARDSLPALLGALKEGRAPAMIPGVCLRDGGEVLVNCPVPGEEGVEDFLFPARDLLPYERYFSPFSGGGGFTAMLASGGCPFSCSYCCLAGNLRSRRLEGVTAEMEECFKRYDIRNIDFYDSVFTYDKERVLRLCGAIRRLNLPFSWTARTRLDLVDGEILGAMSAAGCRMLMYGIETFHASSLRRMNRPVLSVAQIREKIRLTRRKGIAAFGFFMLGIPGETEEIMKRTINLSKSIGLDFAQFTKLTPIGGTALYDLQIKATGDDYWRDYIGRGNRDDDISAVGCLIPQAALLKAVHRANIGFYFRLTQIMRILFEARSFRRLLRYARSALNMAFSRLKAGKKAGDPENMV